MSQKNRYRIAGIIFGALLVYELYKIGRFFWVWISKDPFMAWISLGHRQVSVVWFVMHVLCVLLSLIALWALLIGAIKQKTNLKTKTLYAGFYCVGMLVPWSALLKNFQMMYLHMRFPYLVRILAPYILPILCVLLFLVALYKLMESPAEHQKAVEVEAINEKIEYYQKMLSHNVITKREYDAMVVKINRGQL